MIVDDNRTSQYMLEHLIRQLHHRVVIAGDGMDAITQLESMQPDLILLDLIMPNMNGLEVLKRLKSHAEWCHIPVLMISASEDARDTIECIQEGADDFLPKPFDPVLLRARVHSCLEKKRMRDRELLYLEEVEAARKRADELLRVILPAEVVEELQSTGAVRPRRFPNVAVMFADIVGFTHYCDKRDPEEIVKHLQELIRSWEQIALKHGIEKIKTIGDAMMGAAGLLGVSRSPVLDCIRGGLEMQEAMAASSMQLQARIGIHFGPVVAGVIGTRQYLFDVWGDTVNFASRVEANGVPGAITLSAAAREQALPHGRFESLGQVLVKGKGLQEIFRFVDFMS